MSHFYGDMKGARGETTRCGTKSSGMQAHIRGWDVGAKVYIQHSKNGKDTIIIYKTGGSHCGMNEQLICTFTKDGQL
jgi:hypothetical protein